MIPESIPEVGLDKRIFVHGSVHQQKTHFAVATLAKIHITMPTVCYSFNDK